MVVSSIAASGCTENCGVGAQLNGVVYDAFMHPVGPWEVANANAFPAEASPGNGPLLFELEWGNLNEGPITVMMDGQAFDGDGVFYQQECGNMEIIWSGQYLSAIGSKHNFAARALLQFYGTTIAGQVTNYSETWAYENDVGSYSSVISELYGDSVGSGTTN